MKLKCCICKRVMRKLHFDGRCIRFPTYTSDDLDLEWIEFPQPLCKRCAKEFKKWLEDQNIVLQKYKKRRQKVKIKGGRG